MGAQPQESSVFDFDNLQSLLTGYHPTATQLALDSISPDQTAARTPDLSSSSHRAALSRLKLDTDSLIDIVNSLHEKKARDGSLLVAINATSLHPNYLWGEEANECVGRLVSFKFNDEIKSNYSNLPHFELLHPKQFKIDQNREITQSAPNGRPLLALMQLSDSTRAAPLERFKHPVLMLLSEKTGVEIDSNQMSCTVFFSHESMIEAFQHAEKSLNDYYSNIQKKQNTPLALEQLKSIAGSYLIQKLAAYIEDELIEKLGYRNIPHVSICRNENLAKASEIGPVCFQVTVADSTYDVIITYEKGQALLSHKITL